MIFQDPNPRMTKIKRFIEKYGYSVYIISIVLQIGVLIFLMAIFGIYCNLIYLI